VPTGYCLPFALAAESAGARLLIAERNGAVDEHEHVVLRVQVAGVERLRVDDLERELVLLEDPARPA